MLTFTDPAAMSAWSAARRRSGQRVGFVPTMGFLHRGHASLMSLLRPQVDVLAVSIFVNPLQFGPNEDLSRYPRDPEGDARLCAGEGVDALFMPTDFYPDGFSTRVELTGITEPLCGRSRPTHFAGVTTVVARLFGVVGCDVAAFGEKDFQQLAVIRRMVRDLALSVEVVGGALVRDEDGVALSSRNKYLGPQDRVRARSLSQALFAMQRAVASGERDAASLLRIGQEKLTVDRPDYLEIRDGMNLEPVTTVSEGDRAFVAAYVGNTRLIDNVALVAP